MNGESQDPIFKNENKEDYEDAYRQHASAFRTWLIAYGVGLPVFLASNEAIWVKFAASSQAKCTAYLFLGGVLLQAVLSLIDKYADWFCLSVIHGRIEQNAKRAAMGRWWMKNDWPSIVLDLLSIGLFGLATIKLLRLFS